MSTNMAILWFKRVISGEAFIASLENDRHMFHHDEDLEDWAAGWSVDCKNWTYP